MKKVILMTTFLILSCGFVFAQKCNVQGIVRYEHNEYVGYKVDVGAEVKFVKAKDVSEQAVKDWKTYYDLADRMVMYLESLDKEDRNNPLLDDGVRKIVKFSKEDQQRLLDISGECLKHYIIAIKEPVGIGLVDNSGKYTLSLPYGEYYVFAKSANRDRPTLAEITGRIIMEKVTINKPSMIVSFDFSY